MVKRSLLVLLYLVVAAGAFFVAFRLEQRFLKGIGWAVLALLAALAVEIIGEGILEVPKAFAYAKYRKEWERANRDGADTGSPPEDRHRGPKWQ